MAKLYYYYAAMNAGKSTTLLQASYNYNERGMETIIFISSLDNRYKIGHVTSRTGLEAKALVFDQDFDFLIKLQEFDRQKDISCVFVDEAQFLTSEQVLQLCRIVDDLKIPVLCYGLRTDFQGKLFSGSEALFRFADCVSELKTICYCGRKATMNMRIDKNGIKVSQGPQIEIGGNDRYISVCRRHFFDSLT